MRYLLYLLLLLATPALAQDNVFEQLLQIRQAERYLTADRFRDAERTIEPVYHALQKQPFENPDRYIKVVEMLATSRSQQGHQDSVVDLLLEQHRMIARYYHEHGAAYAASLARLAEAHYRDGQKYNAIEFVERALAIYLRLNPAPVETVKTLRGNLVQYRLAPFSLAFVPPDLSEFYSRCEQLQQSAANTEVTLLMQDFVEVGVDYEPSGSWIPYFELLKTAETAVAGNLPGNASPEMETASKRRRIFLPDASVWQRDELCLVDVRDGNVINAMTETE
ncbi:MAG: hypothetical protein KTR33_14735 [Gammaproteobacteria bacterium]|nr:hypothetical protein [Gammaproteobacteria bacterium]